MKVPVLIVISTFSLVSIGNSCNVVSWGYSSSYYDDYNSGPQVGFGYYPGFFGSSGGFLGLLMATLMSRHLQTPPRVVHHHHHHYYKEKPGGGFDYQYQNEGPKWDRGSYGPGYPSSGPEAGGPKWDQGSYGPGNPSAGPEARGPKSGGPFSNFFRNMFYRR